MNAPLTPEDEGTLRTSIAEVLAARTRVPLISEISEVTARHFHIPLEKLLGQSRKREFARPRQVAMYLSRHLTSRSWPEIGRRFGGRDHTTVMHAVRQINSLRSTDSELDHAVREIGERSLAIAAARATAHLNIDSSSEGNPHV